MVLGNGVWNSTGRPSTNEKNERLNGFNLRDIFRLSLMYNEMRRPRKTELTMDITCIYIETSIF